MNLFGGPGLRFTPEYQRAENAIDGFGKVCQEFKEHNLLHEDPVALAAFQARWPQAEALIEELGVRQTAVLAEMAQARRSWSREVPETLEALNAFSVTLEARTQVLRARKLEENRMIIALSYTLDEPEEALLAWQSVLMAYFLVFPDRLPKAVGKGGRFSLVARVLDHEVQSSDFTAHESAELAQRHAEAIAVARGAELAPWDTWMYPGGEQVYRTVDQSGCSYRVSELPMSVEGTVPAACADHSA